MQADRIVYPMPSHDPKSKIDQITIILGDNGYKLTPPGGRVAGTNISRAFYTGTWCERDGRIGGTVHFIADESGAELVSGLKLPPKTKIRFDFDVPKKDPSGHIFPLKIGDEDFLVILDVVFEDNKNRSPERMS
ncbi:hypothetical protein [Methylobacterium aquaticum]|uniref:hypothetical protein n=1 Tax=Methylobacterium aquaticum TaxID=270351 RepID=UPI000ACA062D|nr:hypothetical protein [Methylobacterium aquaticum]